MSPESIGQQVYSKKSDVWMFGIVVYEIVSQREPHSNEDPHKISSLIRYYHFSVCSSNLNAIDFENEINETRHDNSFSFSNTETKD
jgi:hypothetical protein